jgi:hypothetical protein
MTVHGTAGPDCGELTAMFQADFGETVAKLCEAVRDMYGDGGAQMLADTVEAALKARVIRAE